MMPVSLGGGSPEASRWSLVPRGWGWQRIPSAGVHRSDGSRVKARRPLVLSSQFFTLAINQKERSPSPEALSLFSL